jgi:tRNA threonylcarbamoyladenosine biosynthesis protein TsaE
MIKMVISDESELEKVARKIIAESGDFPILCFNGEMGAGKTTLIKVICGLLGVEDAMSSPTFSIVNEYESGSGDPIYHFDFYRIEELREAIDIGVDEYFYSGNLCLIEWSEKIKQLIPEEHLEISIKLVGNTGREIIISPHGG